MSDKNFVAVARVDEVAPNTVKVVEVNGLSILLAHSAGKLFAVRNLCSHADEKLECGRMKNGWIACPIHGARFDMATGNPMNPPATQPIDTYEVRVEGEMIEIAV
jgi:3-phenylpropionate/trans-cinnamate dioxygenase ferredoxin subunit